MYKLIKKVCLLLTLTLLCVHGELTASYFKTWGPGLKPQTIVMPARYFFIKPLNDSEGCSNIAFDIKIEGVNKDKRLCRIWTNVLNTQHCTHIVRYKLYETCESLTISIKYNNSDVAESPYVINNKIYSEDCNCPVENLDKWLLDWECGEIPDQITNDLANFKFDINFTDLREKIITKFDHPGAVSLCNYVIKDNKIYRRCYGKYVGFKMFMDNILLSLSRKVLLPDMEFFVNLGDWPLVNELTEHFPIFSWCGSTNTIDIIMPTYDITESTLENMGRVMLDMLSVQGNVKEKWDNRIPKVFWRGRDSNRERLHLIDISKEYPDLFNVSLTNYFFFHSEEQKYGPKTPHISFFSFFDYKYQLCIDGTVAAYRLPYLLAGGSLLLKPESKYYEHFYNDLIPNVHYIPVKANLSDLVDKIQWALQNDGEAKKVAEAGQQFAINKLLPKDIFCYHAFLLREFSKKIVSEVRILEGMEAVEHPEANKCECDENVKDEL